MNFSPNPRAASILRAAHDTYREAGLSVQGALPRWLAVPNDPGKSAFWYKALVDDGISPPAATQRIECLERVKRGW